MAGGAGGKDGDSIEGSYLFINNNGAIDGAGTADAIDFTGGDNTLVLAPTSAMSGNIGLNDNSILTIDQSLIADATLANVITGDGSLVVKGGGYELTLTGLETYTGGTTIDSGTLEIDSTGTTSATAAAVGDILMNGGVLEYVVDDTIDNNYEVSGVISGAGSVDFAGQDGEIITLTGKNTFSGSATKSPPASWMSATIRRSARSLSR